jgi:diguanylate cyclase (GGDEF)-like protein/PAS domain S-box-containing protein
LPTPCLKRKEKMNIKVNYLNFYKNIWRMFFILSVLAVVFGIYVFTEKKIDRAHELRHFSYLLADQLRQSSDDLTRMVRSYVMTGDPRYKRYYQGILDIRNGTMPRPEGYMNSYWDLVVANELSEPAKAGQGIPLLDLMRQAGFTDEELGKLAQAKANSDDLTALEFDAMKLAESTGPNAEANRMQARQMLYDAGYNAAKATIMKPINEVYGLVDARTLASVRAAESSALVFRWLFIAGVFGAVFLLKRAHTALNATLGCTAVEMQAHMRRIAHGDSSAAIKIPPGLENSVLAGLAEMQAILHAYEIERKKNEQVLRENESRLQALFNTMAAGIVVINEKGDIEDLNPASEQLFGYSAAEIKGQNVKALMPEPHHGNHDRYLKNRLKNGQKKINGKGQEVIGKRKDGTTFPMMLLLNEAVQFGHRVFIGFVLDITERKLAEQTREKLLYDAKRNAAEVEAILASQDDVIIFYDMNMNVRRVNPAFLEKQGFDPVGLNVKDIIQRVSCRHLDGRPLVLRHQPTPRALRGEKTLNEPFTVIRADGDTAIVETSSRPMQVDGRVMGSVTVWHDITARKQFEDTLKALQSRLEFLLKSTPAVIYACRASGDFAATFVSDNVVLQLGYHPGNFIEDPEFWLNHIHPEDRPTVLEGLVHVLEKGFHKHEYRFLHQDGGYRWMYDELIVIRDNNGQSLELVGYWTDITDRKKAEEELRIAAATFETHEAIMITDVNAAILRVNHAFETITGYSADEVVGQNPRILSSNRHDKTFYRSMWQNLLTTGIWEGEIWDRRKSGEIYPKWLRITALKDSKSKPTEYVGIFTDMTERKKAEQEIHNLAFYDPLTSLPNRRLLLDRLDLALSSSERSQQYGALLFLDMDKFKSLNDILGHHVGDQMLIEVAERIKFSVREIDTVARFGGDEFIVLLEELGEEIQNASQRAALIAEKIRRALAVPFHFQQHVHTSSPSIGVCMYFGHAFSSGDLIRHADIAMYQAKHAGRNRVQFFDPVLQHSVETRAALESDLRHALSDRQLHLYYQVQYNDDGKPFGAEALLRWIHPERGMISPVQFIPIAEESSLILEIGHWVLDTACQQLAAWDKDEATRHLLLAINVSAHQFMMADFVELIETKVKVYGIRPSRLKLELTESVILNDIEEIVHKMQLLEKFGIRLSLDDFGTGYSSLSYLKRLPIHQIKIDQSFVRDIVSDPNDAVMVKNIIDIARNFNLNVIAEGVETKEQLEFLQKNGCPAYQGYLFGKPMPIEEFEELIRHDPGCLHGYGKGNKSPTVPFTGLAGNEGNTSLHKNL